MVAQLGRVFFAVDLDAEIRSLVAAQIAGLAIPGKPVPPSNWHLTLRFVGDIDDVGYDRLLARVDQADLGDPFRISFTALGAFPKPRRATVLWRGVDDPAARLAELAGCIEDACQSIGMPAEDRPYRPHLTLSRIRPDQDVRALVDDTDLPPVQTTVTAVTLFRSHLGGRHARYEPMETFPLG